MGNACKSAFNFFTCSCLRRSNEYSFEEDVKEEMKKLGAKEMDVTQITLLVEFIDKQLSRIKAKLPGTASPSNITMAKNVKDHIKPESVHSCIKFASKIIERVLKEVEELQKTGITQEMGRVAANAVKAIGQSHWALLGLWMVASVLERIETVSSNLSDCVKLLEIMFEIAKNLQELNSVLSQEADHHHKQLIRAVEIIVEGATICCDYIAKGNKSRFWSAGTVETQLKETRTIIQEITASLTLTTVTAIGKQIGHREEESPRKLLEIVPVGIDDRVEAVKKLLEMEGSKAALAVILYGFGGMGKSTLASSVIENLNLKNFKFSRVIVDAENSNIVKLQKDIISDLEGKKFDLRNDYEGRKKLGEVLKSKSCFLFIDNVVDKEYMRRLLPKGLSMGKNKLRILVTSRGINVRQEINIHCEEHHVESLSEETSRELLRKTILQEMTTRVQMTINDEDKMISDIAKACHGVPLLLDTYGKYLRCDRSEAAYRGARDSLIHGKFRTFGNDKDLSEQLFYVYDRMREDSQEAFLDICTYFNGWKWDIVSSVVGEELLNDLVSRALVKKDVHSEEIAVHDVLMLMGTKRAKATRMQSTAELSQSLQDEQDVSSAKGIRLQSPFKLESRYLNAMYKSLRILILENGITIDGDQCNHTFHKLLFLQVRDVNMFPFKDASQLPNLRVFYDESEHGMALAKLPETLKQLKLTISPTHEMSAALPIRWANMSSLPELQRFEMRTSKLVEFPENFRLPKSLVELDISRCKQLPKGFDSLTALRKLMLNGCTELTALPEELGSFHSLMSLSMSDCTKLTSLPKAFGRLTSFKDLSLMQCKSLEALPEDFGKLSSLEFLKMDGCESLKALSEGFGELSSLRELDLSGCFKLASLPEGFGSLGKLEWFSLSGCMESLPEDCGNLCNLKTLILNACGSLSNIKGLGKLHSLESLEIYECLKELPERFHDLPLRYLDLSGCSSLMSLPMRFGELRSLEVLLLRDCLNLSALPDGFGNLKSLRYLNLDSPKLDRLPRDFKHLSCLSHLYMINCTMLEGETMDIIVTLESLCLADISGSNKLEKRWEEMQKEEKEYPLVVMTSEDRDGIERRSMVEKYRRAAAVAFFHGQCLMVDGYENYKTVSSSNRIEAEKKVALLIGQHNQVQRMGGVLKSALERLNLPASTMIVYIAVDTDDGDDQINSRQILKLLPEGSSASIDFRTRTLFREAFYHDECTALVLADVVKEEKGFKGFVNFNNISVVFLKETGETIFYEFGKFVRRVKESEDAWISQLDNGHPCMDETNEFKKFRDIPVRTRGKYCHGNCDFGLGDFYRLQERMPMLTLLDPVLLDSVKKESLGGKVVMLYGGSPESDFNSKDLYRTKSSTVIKYLAQGCRSPVWRHYGNVAKIIIIMSRNSPKKRMFWRLVNHMMEMDSEDSDSGWAVVFDGDGEMVALRGKEVVEMLWKSDGKEEEKMSAEAIIESIQNGDCDEIKRRFGDQQEEEKQHEQEEEEEVRRSRTCFVDEEEQRGAEHPLSTSNEIIPTTTGEEIIPPEHLWRVLLFIIGGVILYNILKNKLQTL
eukprot:Gb_36886 [translate_table: standard]